MGPSDYDIVRQIGKGAFGSTLLVNRRLGVTVPNPVHGEQFIMKVMSKGSIAPIERSRILFDKLCTAFGEFGRRWEVCRRR